MKTLSGIVNAIPSAQRAQLKACLGLSVLVLVLDFISVVLLVPLFAGLFNPGFDFGNKIPALSRFTVFFRENQILIVLGIVAFFVLKNGLSQKIIKFQSRYYYQLSNALSVGLLRDYFGKSLLEVKTAKNSALVKDIIFVPNNFVLYVLASAIQLFSEGLLLVLILLVSLAINPLATLFLAILAGLVVGVLYFYDRTKLEDISGTFTEKYNSNFNHLLNAVNGYAEIKTNQIEGYFLQKFNASNAALNAMHGELHANRQIKPKHTETFLVITAAALFLLSSYFSSGIDVVFMSFLFAATIKIIPSLNRILIGLANLKSNLYTIEILQGKNHTPNENDQRETAIVFEEKIELENIGFAFKNTPVLQQASIIIKKGEIVGIFGDSGNGKSTLANIISALITPDSGKIYCDGIAVDASNKKAYRQLMAYVTQSPFVLEGTILENLVLDDDSGKRAFLKEYLDLFELTPVIDVLPKGLDTFIGSNGYALSGGQLQRLAIIRALARNPKLLILDEATNQLDGYLRDKTAAILKDISRKKGLAVVIISHNKNELDHSCDTIYELKYSNLTKA